MQRMLEWIQVQQVQVNQKRLILQEYAQRCHCMHMSKHLSDQTGRLSAPPAAVMEATSVILMPGMYSRVMTDAVVDPQCTVGTLIHGAAVNLRLNLCAAC